MKLERLQELYRQYAHFSPQKAGDIAEWNQKAEGPEQRSGHHQKGFRCLRRISKNLFSAMDMELMKLTEEGVGMIILPRMNKH